MPLDYKAKVGGLAAWKWGVIGGGGLAVYLMVRRRTSTSPPSPVGVVTDSALDGALTGTAMTPGAVVNNQAFPAIPDWLAQGPDWFNTLPPVAPPLPDVFNTIPPWWNQALPAAPLPAPVAGPGDPNVMVPSAVPTNTAPVAAPAPSRPAPGQAGIKTWPQWLVFHNISLGNDRLAACWRGYVVSHGGQPPVGPVSFCTIAPGGRIITSHV